MSAPADSPSSDEAPRSGVRYVPLYCELTADTLTPVSAYHRLAEGDWSFLFESVVGGERIGRYSFAGAEPFLTIRAWGNHVRIERPGDSGSVAEFESADPLSELEKLLQERQAERVEGLPWFSGGAVGYAGYDTIRYSESLPNVPEDDRGLPDLSFAFYDSMVIFDHIRKVIQVVVLLDRSAPDQEAAAAEAQRRLEALCHRLQDGKNRLQLKSVRLGTDTAADAESNFTQPEFCDAVERCREYIRAGDIFQVVFSQRLRRSTTASPLEVYRALRMVNPSPFMFLLGSPDCRLVGSSPEIMVRVEHGETTIRPLAGTRPRGGTAAEDQALADELLADPKERAEHVMLIDLARNDIGRVCQSGSVELSDVMVVERYSHVMHITSNVTGLLEDGLSPIAALRAGLPAGTVSGAPKVRAMEIIDEIEPHKRGPYAGAVGYIDFTGNMDTCIALRTLVIRDGVIDIQAGAGIVADSVPESEYQETLNKARAMLKAIAVAEQQLTETKDTAS